MAELIAHCPRCGATHVTFEVSAVTLVNMQYGWQHFFEAFSVCRHCRRSTIFVLEDRG
jgi:hypothetical protein